MADKYQAMLGMGGGDAPASATPPPPDKYQAMLGMGDGSSMSQGSGRVNTGTGSLMSDPVDDTGRGAGFLTTLRASMAPDDQDKIRRFAASRFPSLNIDEAVKLYGIQDGNIVYYDTPKGQFVREVPSVSGAKGPLDAFNRVGRFVANETGAALPGVAGGVAGALTGGAAAIPVAAGTAAVTDIARQALDKATAGEEVDIDYGNAAMQGAGSVVGEGMGKLAGRILSNNPLGVGAWEKVRALDPAKILSAQDLMAEAKSRGVTLTVAEATDLRSLLQQQRQLGRYDETSKIINDVVKERNRSQIPAAFRNELDMIAAPKPAGTAAGEAVAAAEGAIKKAKETRAAQTSPKYKEAFASGAQPDVTDTLAVIDDGLARVPPGSKAYARLTEARNLLGETVKIGNAEVFRPYTFEQLHNSKTTLDGMLKVLGMPDQADASTAKHFITDAKTTLMGELKRTHPAYAEGAQLHIDLSPEIDALKKGGVGLLAKKTGPEVGQLLDVIFDARGITPEDVAKARSAFLIAGKQGEWNSALRTWLDGKLSDAMKPQNANIPGRLQSSLWNDDRQKAIIQAAIGDPGRVDGFNKLMNVVEAAARALPEGSPTVTDLASPLASDSVGRGLKIAGQLANPVNLVQAPEKLANAYSAMKTPEARIKLAEALMDGKAMDDLKRLRLLSPGSEKAATTAVNFLTRVGIIGAGTALGVRGDSYLEAPVASEIAKERSSQRPAPAR